MKNLENVMIRKETVEVKGVEIEFEEYYMIDPESGEEIFNRELEIENDLRLYDIYKKTQGLLTSSDIKNIRGKYDMTQKEFALAIGVGEVTIHRFENGSIQTDSVDSIIRLSSDPDNMCMLLTNNHKNFPNAIYAKLMNTIKELQISKAHKIADLDNLDSEKLKLKKVDAVKLAYIVVSKYNDKYEEFKAKNNIESSDKSGYITHLKLQKLLYYIQALALCVFDKVAFDNDILAWQYGPVIAEVYLKYKNKKSLPIDSKLDSYNISNGLNEIINIVIDSYGQIEAKKLIDMTHEEDPWKCTDINNVIKIEDIKEYFNSVYN